MTKLDAHGLHDIDFSKITVEVYSDYSATIALSCPLIVFTFSPGFSSLEDSVDGRNVSPALGTVLSNAEITVTGILSAEECRVASHVSQVWRW
jgi:hypothetical protein